MCVVGLKRNNVGASGTDGKWKTTTNGNLEHYEVNYNPPYSYYTVPPDKNGKLFVKDGAFGQTSSITDNITQKFALEASYYYELSNLYRNAKLNASAENVWRFQQITLGLRYAFLNVKKKESK